MKRKRDSFLSVDLACLSGFRAAVSSGFTERRNEIAMATVSGNRELSGIFEGISSRGDQPILRRRFAGKISGSSSSQAG
jgi:hypothetical protein